MPNNTPWTSNKIWSAVLAAAVPLVGSMILGRLFKPGPWYWCLNRSCLSPPGWMFGLVWTALYILLGVALVAACYGTDDQWTWVLPIVNIVVTMLFAPMMFGLRSPMLGLTVTFLALLLGIGVIVQYVIANDSVLAASLMGPYVAWLVLASYLAWYVWRNNNCAKLAECEKKAC